MKANRAFRDGDEAVSPVIAVILMVAITVVLAATVYVWVSGFGSSNSTPAKTISLASAGTITMGDYEDVDAAADDAQKSYTITAGTAGMRYSDLTLTVNGVALTFGTDADCTADDDDGGTWFACAGATTRASTAAIAAGDELTIVVLESTLSGATLRLLDTQANSVIYTLAIG